MHGPTIGCVIDIPDALIATQSKYNGEAGRAFVAALPGRADRFLGGWGLRRDGAAMYGVCALVLPVVRASDGRRAALKLQAQDEETAGEPVALRVWGEAGAEPCGCSTTTPGPARCCWNGWTSGPLSESDERAAVEVLAGLLARLTSVPAPDGLRRLGDRGADAGRGAAGGGRAGGRGDGGCCGTARRRCARWRANRGPAAALGPALRQHPGRPTREPWLASTRSRWRGPGFDLMPAWPTGSTRRGAVAVRSDDGGAGAGPGAGAGLDAGRALQNGLWGVAEGDTVPPDQVEIARQLLGRAE